MFAVANPSTLMMDVYLYSEFSSQHAYAFDAYAW